MKSIGISKNLKTLLQETQKTNNELANHLGVSDSLISSYITKNTLPPLDKIIKIADYFKVTIDDLIFEKNKYEFNSTQEPKVEYHSFAKKRNCALTGEECPFRGLEALRLRNKELEEELLKIKGK